jgi:hypothetical protein
MIDKNKEIYSKSSLVEGKFVIVVSEVIGVQKG